MTSWVSLSGGVASWAAARLIIDEGKTPVLLFADTLIEDEDLYRFLDDAEADLGIPITRIADGRTPWEVFADVKFVGNTRVDPCSLHLKRKPLRDWIDAHHEAATVVVGIDWTEAHRMDRITYAYQPHTVRAPLIERNMDKCQALDMLADRGIEAPRLYKMGFPHNNCGGFCVKAGQAQFAALLREFPDRYAEHEASEHDLREQWGKDVAILRDRRGGDSTPMTLRSFRERIERTGEYDRNEWGGCGCALDGQPFQLALDLFAVPGDGSENNG